MLSALFLVAALQADPSPAVLTRIAFGSCARENRPQPIWEAIAAYEPEALVLLGDNIYGDTDDAAVLRAKWAQLAAVPTFKALRARVPLLATWDDHDYGRNDAGAEFPLRAESQTAFLDFLGVSADDPRRARVGVYHAETFGEPGRRVQVILLDTRSHRGPLVRREGPAPVGEAGPYGANLDPDVTVLGEEQWRWLAEQLRQPAEVRLLATSIQLVSEEHGWEAWARFPHERARLLALLAETRASGVIALSGDRHSAEISVLRPVNDGRRPSYPLFDVTASSLNQPRRWTFEHNRHRLGDLWFDENFGTLDVDWGADDPTVTLALRDVQGRVVVSETVALSALTPPPEVAPESVERLERIAFGSCNQQSRPTPLWDDVLAADPDLFLFLGDNVYGDTEDMDVLRRAYADLAAQPGYAALRAVTPVLATWDDHDYATNDAGNEYPLKRESQRVFLEAFEEPSASPRWSREGVYGSWLYGPPDERVQVILLDLRTHRDPWGRATAPAPRGAGQPGDYAPVEDGTILGDTQWRWLEEQLRVPARLRLVGSSLQCLPTGHVWECWALRPHERERLFDVLARTRANGVVLLSGDTHWAELSRVEPRETGLGYPLVELTSSGLNQGWEWTNIENPERVGVPLWAPNFGLVTIDWERGEVRLEARGERVGDTNPRVETTLELDGLFPPAR